MKSMKPAENCLLRIMHMSDDLHPAERRIADYVLNHPEQVITVTMEELGDRTDSSYATVNRFCRRLGFSGYRAFRQSLVVDLTEKKNIDDMVHNLSVTSESSVENVCESVYDLAFKVLSDSLGIINTSTIEAVVNVLTKANKICFVGVGISGMSAQYAHSRLFRIGLNCIYNADSTLSSMQVSLLRQGDVLFAISSSGRTSTIVEAARLAKKNGVTVIGLSDFSVSPLSKVCDYNLFTTGRNTSFFLDIDIQFITGQISIIDVIYMCCCVALDERASENYTKTVASGNREKIGGKTTLA